MSIANNFTAILERIHKAEAKAKREIGSTTLVAVSKGQSLSKLQAALGVGQRLFGENYVQELLEKHAALPEAKFHFIGNLQSNKVRKIVGKVELIHSIDSIDLAAEVSRRADQNGIIQDILLEVNIGDENTKSGVALRGAHEMISGINALKAIRLRGLMALPPFSEDESIARGYLRKTFELYQKVRDELSMESKIEFSWLSMGTSHDFEWAIEEGATHVRVGTAIFGEREKK